MPFHGFNLERRSVMQPLQRQILQCSLVVALIVSFSPMRAAGDPILRPRKKDGSMVVETLLGAATVKVELTTTGGKIIPPSKDGKGDSWPQTQNTTKANKKAKFSIPDLVTENGETIKTPVADTSHEITYAQAPGENNNQRIEAPVIDPETGLIIMDDIFLAI